MTGDPYYGYRLHALLLLLTIVLLRPVTRHGSQTGHRAERVQRAVTLQDLLPLIVEP
jgi:hypothetical protein